MKEKAYTRNCPEITLKYKTDADAKKIKILTSSDVYRFLKTVFDADTIEYKEEFILLLTNRANNTIGWMKVSSGGISGTVVDAKIIFGVATKAGASGIILAHNHPSGQLTPSEQDRSLTKKIKEGCKLMDISLLDHIIMVPETYPTESTTGKYYSFADEGVL